MAKSTKSNDSRKISFGKRKSGKAKKSFNKHDNKSRPTSYRGQGR